MRTHKIAIILSENLLVWQKLNVTAFLSSGLASSSDNSLIGERYRDKAHGSYLPIFNQPVIIYSCSPEKLKTVHNRTASRDVVRSIYIEDMFITDNDSDNRDTLLKYDVPDLPIVGIGVFGSAKDVDKILSGVKRHG